jgi:hypothetical protein
MVAAQTQGGDRICPRTRRKRAAHTLKTTPARLESGGSVESKS